MPGMKYKLAAVFSYVRDTSVKHTFFAFGKYWE